MNTTLEYSTRVVQEGDRRCKKSTLNDLAYLTPLRIPLMNPVIDSLLLALCGPNSQKGECSYPVLEFLNNIWGLGTDRNRAAVPARQAA
jgi:hypothetical protein